MHAEDLSEPRNAAELAYLQTGRGTLPERKEGLRYLHARGLTLPDTPDAAARGAWADFKAPPAPARAATSAAATAAAVTAAPAPPPARKAPRAAPPTASPAALLGRVDRVRLAADDHGAEQALDFLTSIAREAIGAGLSHAGRMELAKAIDAARVRLFGIRQTAGVKTSLSVLSRQAALVQALMRL
jgi:hypothetical protein